MARKPPPKFVLEKHEGYRTIFQTGMYGGPRVGYFEWVIYTDETVADDALSTFPPDPAKTYIKRIIQCKLVMTPHQAKSLVDLLNQSVSNYEKTFGEIPTPKDIGKRKPPPPSMIT